MQPLEATFEATVAEGNIPGAVLAASTTDGKIQYKKSIGSRTLKEGHVKPMELDTLFWLGSCTKLLTAIAALQCVETGKLALDEDVTGILPELKDIEVQTPSKDSKDSTAAPVLTRAKNKITLRNLLTHTSGLSYTKFGDLSLPLLQRCLAPLVFEPGQGFIYGTGTDFAGFMVERVSGLSLESYIQKHIAAPLGIDSICFRPREHPELCERLADVSLRAEKSGPVQWTKETIWPLDQVGDSGGSGAYSTLVDYQQVMHCLTANDGRLLSHSMVDEMFRPDMRRLVRDGVMKALEDDNRRNIYGGLPKGAQATYAIGGMVVLEDLSGRRPRGSLHWGGLLNVFFWMDRDNGVSGIFGTQLFPAGDPKSLHLFAEFEKSTYETVRGDTDNE